MATDDDNREHGVEFGSLGDELAAEEYPLDAEALVETYGSREIEVKGDNQTLGELVGPLGDTTFESVDDVQQSIVSMVSDDAVGRENYSDRGGSNPHPDRQEESM